MGRKASTWLLAGDDGPVQPVNRSPGICCGDGAECNTPGVRNRFLVSNDLGLTWALESSPFEHALRAISMPDRQTVVVGGTGAILRHFVRSGFRGPHEAEPFPR